MFHPLLAVSPIDGRYHKTTTPLSDYFSEYALFKYRLFVEIEYLIAFSEEIAHPISDPEVLREVYRTFSLDDCFRIKEIEQVTNHDIKALEYFAKERINSLPIKVNTELVHFGLTSQDINNTAIPLAMKEATEKEILPVLKQLVDNLELLAEQWLEVPMLARTHGQPASPTRLGKELFVFIERLENQLAQLEQVPFSAKFGGCIGNFNAHTVAYLNVDWHDFANRFVEETLGLTRSRYTTQIEHYDNLAAWAQNLGRINTILIDMCRDLWGYISINYFKQKLVEGEVGSSAMPHKVNPIDFENAEGNLGMANAIFQHFAEKLPISRFQRDLTDSTVLRNLGVPLAHTLIAYQSVIKGLNKLELNNQQLKADLANNAVVITEGIQTILRKIGYPMPYEALKALSRGKAEITLTDIYQFVDSLDVTNEVKEVLKDITPENYLGQLPE